MLRASLSPRHGSRRGRNGAKRGGSRSKSPTGCVNQQPGNRAPYRSNRGRRMPSRISRISAGTACAAFIVLAVMAWGARAVPACACGEFRGSLVASGKSLYGVPWRIKAALVRTRWPQGSWDRTLEFHFSHGPEDDYTGGGHFTGLPLPLHPEFVLTATFGEIDEPPESHINGVTRRRVWTLTVEMSGGESVSVQPTLAPSPLLKRFRWLRGVRFYDVFFPAEQTPRAITAFDRVGHVLARYRKHRGVFR
jgi:hypothetical protein